MPLYLDGVVQIDEAELSSFRRIYSDSICTKTCLEKRLSDNPSIDLINRFNHFFIINHKDYDEFIAKHMTWPSCKQDIELIKKLYDKYHIRIIGIEALRFDKTESHRKEFIAYYQWLISLFNQKKLNPIAIGMSFFNGVRSSLILHKLSIEFAEELLVFVSQYPQAFRCETSSINELKEYINACHKID